MKTLSVAALVFFTLVNNSFSEIRRVPQVYLTIQTAIDSCSFQDTILVDKGSYFEQITINKPLTMIGMDKDSVILYSRVTIKASNVNIQQLKLSTSGYYAFPVQIIIDSSSNIRIERLYLEAPNGEFLYGFDGGNNMNISASKEISLLSVVMTAGGGAPGDPSHTAYHVGGNGGYGITINNSTNIVIDSCTIYGGDAGPLTYNTPPGYNGNSIILRGSSVTSVSNSKLKYEVNKDSSSSIVLSNTTIIMTSVFETKLANSAPSNYQLSQNYPNPFNPSTIISFSIPSKLVVSLTVYDVSGRKVATLVNEELSAGNYACQWNATNVSSGVYFYRIQAGTFRETKKLLLLR